MANPWDNDPVVAANPWDADPIVSDKPKVKSVKELPQRQTSAFEDFGQAHLSAGKALNQFGKNIGAGALRGAGSIGATLLTPLDAAARAMNKGKPVKIGDTEILGQERRNAMDWSLGDMGAETDSLSYKGGKLGTEIAGTLGVGGALANGARFAAPAIANSARGAKVLNAVASGGFRTGAPAATTLGGKAADMAIRSAGGAATGGASAGLINPDDAGIGAMIGGALPPALKAVGTAGRAIGARLAGPAIAPEVRQAVQQARDVGYVIPPTQARPTLANRALEGFAGKLTTAQNASAKNQGVTNELARKAIGAADLTEAGIAQVRAQANQAYDALGSVGKFQADAGFSQALDNAASTSAAMRQNFPELANSKVDDLIAGLKSRGEFEAQPTIEAIKRFRADASTNKLSLDPAAKALGKAQSKISDALEDLIERNLQASGNPQLLAGYREARKTLAKTYQVEKALNKTSGNVDANKLAQMMQKGKPMTGDLRTIADFASRFPKANQTVERMGSLPGVSPLDFGALGTVSAVSGNPLLMAGVLARPAARSAVLSGPVQNRLAKASGQPGTLQQILEDQRVQQALYRVAPPATTSR